ncbi:MAG: hypothetical protein ABIQ43_04960 [Sphingomonas sp.]
MEDAMILAGLGMALSVMGAAPEQSMRCAQYWTISAVEVRAGMWEYARRYFEIGWLAARREALKRGQIADYHLLATRNQRDKPPQIQQVTVYANKAQFDAREANFLAIFKDSSVPRPIVVDGKTRDEIFASTTGLEDYSDAFGSGGC